MKKLGIHLGLMGLLLIVLATITLFLLRIYTQHDGELVQVSNLEGVKASKAIELLENLGLEGVVTDTVYKDGAKKMAVINQNPAAGLNVKRGRKVYLVINTDKVAMVMMPDLAEKTSLPQAQSILKRAHLRLGKIIRQVDASVRSKNDEPVLAQYESGTNQIVAPGTLVERNSEIDLVIGVPANYFDSDSTSVDVEDEMP